jgi:death-on-curing protein
LPGRRTVGGYGRDVDLAGLAAAYGYGLAKNHGFVDGNKRIGFMAMYVFLRLNGLEIETSESEVVTVMTDVASGALGEEGLAEWLRRSTVSR